mgnify:FL=1
MPYEWSNSNSDLTKTLVLWPHQSLPRRGMAAFVLATFGLIIIPLLGLLGTILLWALLPFLLLSVGGIWFALNKSYSDRSTKETLSIDPQATHLKRENPKRETQNWHCNTYWVRVALHPTSGPVPDYVTLSGAGRDVEIGAFLSQEERQQLYVELEAMFTRTQSKF